MNAAASRFDSLRLVSLLLGSLLLVACPPPDDDDDGPVAPPDDDDAPACVADTDCAFSSGLEICGDEGVCTEGDRNNSLEEAQLLEYDSSSALVIAPAGDVDWFRFNGQQGDLVLMTTSADNTDLLDTVIVYYDEDGNEIAFNDDFDRVTSVAPDSRMYSGVPGTGTWYFSVQDRRSWANDPSDPATGGEGHGYVVTLGRAPGDTFVTVVDEPSDDADSATDWSVVKTLVNYTSGGFLEPTGDEDWIEVPVTEGEALRVYGFPNSGSAGSTAVTVMMPDGVTPIRSYEGLAWDTENRALIPALESGSYYLKVQDAEGRGGFDYWYYLHAAKNPVEDGYPAEQEPNDSTETAQALPAESETLWGRIHPAGDQDVFALDAAAGDRVTVSLERTGHGEGTRIHASLIDPAGAVAHEADWDGEEGNLWELQELSEGSWQLLVEEQDPEQGGAGRYYQLTVVLQGS